eukprot:CAMPEP_0117617488 /NCGR_PEP_ID=MMETSP0784-20121206/85618_1 /TAXON_ID=39447 /ORGANISM="" /LENGTH=582 /DNA_ID=CAMNT_0005421331 /DNA_START=17 /DNA_END=1765 /DNA_ORIENTATION=-
MVCSAVNNKLPDAAQSKEKLSTESENQRILSSTRAIDVERYTTYFGSVSNDQGFGVCTDGSGNNYIIGNAAGEIKIWKIDAFGAELSSATSTSPVGSEVPLDCTVDGTGDVLIVGGTQAATLNGVSNPNSPTQASAFLLRYDSSLTLKDTLLKFGTVNPRGVVFRGVAVDSANNVYMAGTTSSDIDGETVVDDSIRSCLISKYDSSVPPVLQWTKVLSTTADTLCNEIAVDSVNGVVYVAGTTKGNIYNPPSGTEEIIVGEYSASTGAFISGVQGLGVSTDDTGSGVVLDSSGTVYVSGQINGNEAYVAKLNSALGIEWLTSFGTGSSLDDSDNLVINSDGYVYVTGTTAQSEFQGYTIPDANGGNIFLARLFPNGTVDYAVGYSSGASNDRGRMAALDGDENVIVAASVGGSVSPDTGLGGTDIFVFSYGEPYPTTAPTAAPSTATPTTAAPSLAVTFAPTYPDPIIIESPHYYLNNMNEKWLVTIPGASCYRLSMDPQSWTPSRKDFVRILGLDGGIRTQYPYKIEKRLYKKRLANFVDFDINAETLSVVWRTDSYGTSYGFKLYITECGNPKHPTWSGR